MLLPESARICRRYHRSLRHHRYHTLVPSRVGDAVAITDAGSAAHAHADARLAHVAALVRSPAALGTVFFFLRNDLDHLPKSRFDTM